MHTRVGKYFVRFTCCVLVVDWFLVYCMIGRSSSPGSVSDEFWDVQGGLESEIDSSLCIFLWLTVHVERLDWFLGHLGCALSIPFTTTCAAGSTGWPLECPGRVLVVPGWIVL